MLKIIATLAAILIPASAMAFSDPPARFQGTPKMPLEIIEMNPKDIREACGITSRPFSVIFGCSTIRLNPKTRCIIIIPDRPVGFVKPEAVLRHEIGHCNGWPAYHPR